MKKLLLVVLFVLWTGFIFYNSSNTASKSNKRSYSVVKLVEKAGMALSISRVNIAEEEKLNYIVRKNAHFFQYLILAVFTSEILFTFGMKGRSAVIYILFISLFIPVMDEFYQRFVPGRSSNVLDVIIDFGGGIVGMVIYYLSYYKIYRWYKKSKIDSSSILK